MPMHIAHDTSTVQLNCSHPARRRLGNASSASPPCLPAAQAGPNLRFSSTEPGLKSFLDLFTQPGVIESIL
jgi:hypothetical protein